MAERLNWKGKRGAGYGVRPYYPSPVFARKHGRLGHRAGVELAAVAACTVETALRFLDAGKSGGVQWGTAIALARACKRLGLPLPEQIQITKGPLLRREELEVKL